MMTDEEVICAWMESRPQSIMDFHANGERGGKLFDGFEFGDSISGCGWWWFEGTLPFHPDKVRNRYLDLDALHEVEDRLTDEQWNWYSDKFVPLCQTIWRDELKEYLRADAPTRIKALAAVLRSEVEHG